MLQENNARVEDQVQQMSNLTVQTQDLKTQLHSVTTQLEKSKQSCKPSRQWATEIKITATATAIATTTIAKIQGLETEANPFTTARATEETEYMKVAPVVNLEKDTSQKQQCRITEGYK